MINPTASTTMLVLLAVLVFIYNFAVGIYSAQGLEPLPSVEFLYTATFLCGVVWWLRAETRTSSVKVVYCAGLIISIGWLVIIPYHLFKTRGARGFVPLSVLVGSFLVAHVSAIVVYMSWSVLSGSLT